MAFDHIGVIGIGQVEFGKVARAQGNQMMAIGLMQHAFATDLMDLDLPGRATDGNLPAQGIAVIHAADGGLDMGGLGGVVMVKVEGRDKLFIHIQARDFGNLALAVPVLHVKRPGKGRGGQQGAQHGGQQDTDRAR